ncbi:C2H2-type zinc-finger protein (macronuclear) [Tetrahymena thermophila SB210]|uniref:C2H2-type zinc-finger protein n=1 Tax=Tetrahymena thermophila (strain SB210) TaxID=312017 RepID=Q22LT3_TETTS|nr:C2H2-type zinc-finger protein [Tetrahymena thermophila SB210]EAR86183.2 C2H2-type zinc-finger protein [Tetrahymena thermophila SB210]|eukprot:XP_976778.2 C2H2-type zinc-finger protein [Tetrahymena thermophila SB210]
MEDIDSQQNLEFVCEQCKRTFSKKSKLSRHVRESHLNIKNFTCTQCNKTFKRNSHLKRHMISHSAEPKPFKCSQCTMQFACKHHLERHIKTLHAEDFPFQCEICPLRFPKRACLYKHLTFIHNLKKPYKCGECDKDFFKNGQLIRHLKRVHPNSFNAQQQLMEAQDYQIQQRIQANLALKNDKKDGKLSADPTKYSSYMNNQSNPTATISTFNNDNAYYSESFQKNQQNATCYYYSLENQIQNLNSLNGVQQYQQQQQQPQSSATSVISFSSSSYPSSTSPANFYDQSQYFKNMTDKYGYDEIEGDLYDEEDDEDDDDDESEDEIYNMMFKQGELKNNKKIQQDDDENSFYLISAAANAASLRPPLKKEKKIKKESKNAPFGGRKCNSSANRKQSTKNEEIYMLDNNQINNFEEQMLPLQKRKLSEEIFCHLGLIGNSTAQNNFNNLNSYFLAAEDELNNANQQLQLQQQQTIEGCSGLENNFLNYSSAYLPQSFGLTPAGATVAQNAVCSASQENSSNEKQQQQQQICTETLINNGSSSSSNGNNVAVQQQFINNNNLNNIQSNIYYQQKHEQEQQCTAAASSQQFGSNTWPLCQSGSAIQGSTTTQKVCYVPGCSTSSMQPTQKQYQQQQQQSQNSYTQTSQQQLTSQVPVMNTATGVFNKPQQQQSSHSLGIQNNNNFSHQSSSQSEPFSVKNEDNGNNTLLPIIYPVETFFNNAQYSQEEAVYPSQSSQQNEVNFDFLNLMDYNNGNQNHNSSTNYHQMLNSDFLQMNSILMMDYSSKLQNSQYQIPQIVLPLSQNGLHSSQHIGINYASIAKTM